MTCQGSSITRLILSSTGLKNSIPWGSLTELSGLQQLWLNNNDLMGSIPETIAKLTKLQQVSLAACYISGTLPPALGELRNLSQLHVSSNYLHGSLPASIARLDKLTDFTASCNNLTGAIPLMDFATIAYQGNCELDAPASYCSSGAYPTNSFSCPLPAGASRYCLAACHRSEVGGSGSAASRNGHKEWGISQKRRSHVPAQSARQSASARRAASQRH